MWTYEKKLQYPVKIATPNPAMAKVIMSQLGGPDGETAASLRYLSQRYAMPWGDGIATLTDIGTEELAHMEIIAAIIHQLTRDLTPEEVVKHNFQDYYVDHTIGVWPQSAGGVPFSSTFFQSKGDPITDLHEDMAAEQKARTTYDNILRLVDDPDVLNPIRFLREREIVHFQRFGETLRSVQERLDSRNFYAFNPAFDKLCAVRPSEARDNDTGADERRCNPECQHESPARTVRRCPSEEPVCPREEPSPHEQNLTREQTAEKAPCRTIYNGNTGRRSDGYAPRGR